MIHRIPLFARWPPVLTHYALTTRICDLAGLREGRHAGARAWPLARNDERKLIHENVTKCLLGSPDLGFSARRAGEGSVQIHAAN